MIERNLFGEEHELFRQTVRRFIEAEIAPYHAQWERDGCVPRELWRKAGAAERKMFGQTLADFQNTQFKLAEIKTEVTVGRVFVDKCIGLFLQRKLDGTDAAMAKMWMSNLHCRVVDECLQMFGGWGYMWEYPIARAYADARVVRIAGGSIEVMKQIIGRSLFEPK